jgi:outer membrane murein-binding lipoprotein Lpp
MCSPFYFVRAAINGEIDANLVVRVKDLESEKATLLSRVTRMQEQLIAAQKEATDAKDQAESLKKQTEQVRRRHGRSFCLDVLPPLQALIHASPSLCLV